MIREYFVAKPRNQWRVIVEGRQHGPFSSDEAARRAAITYARADAKAGAAARVLVEEHKGMLSAVYETGADRSDDHLPSP
ncbi:MAG: hypothetical protein JWR39_2198 [Devosia sp.]|jgi:hypothetical protein|nr:hypothetical protein [Devosia sp.]